MEWLSAKAGELVPRRPAPALIKYRLWRVGTYPVLVDSDGVGFGPQTPAPGPITFHLRLDWLYPVLADSETTRK